MISLKIICGLAYLKFAMLVENYPKMEIILMQVMTALHHMQSCMIILLVAMLCIQFFTIYPNPRCGNCLSFYSFHIVNPNNTIEPGINMSLIKYLLGVCRINLIIREHITISSTLFFNKISLNKSIITLF